MSYNNSIEYSSILQNVQIVKLGFLEIHSVLHLENYVSGDVNVDINNDIQIPQTEKSSEYAILDKYKISGIIKDKSIFDIVTTIILVIESKENLTTEFLEAFSKSNAKLMTYPYLRQAVQDLTSKMGLSALSLPLWQNPIKVEEKKETPAAS